MNKISCLATCSTVCSLCFSVLCVSVPEILNCWEVKAAVSQQVCRQCCGVLVMQRRRESARGFAVQSHPCSTLVRQRPSWWHRVHMSVFPRPSVLWSVPPPPFPLPPASLSAGCSGGSWTIGVSGCAWQNYWALQPIHKWRSLLKSLPKWQACWKQEKHVLV